MPDTPTVVKEETPTAETIDNVKEEMVLDLPTGSPVEFPYPRVCTCDALIDQVTSGFCLGNAMVWDYAMNASQNVSVAFLQMAAKGLVITGETRKSPNIQTMIDNFWHLHSKYLAPSAREVRLIYIDILGHILSLHDAYGFLAKGSANEQHLVELLARECGNPDESEQSVRIHTDSLNRLLEKGLRNLLTEWLSMWGNLPDLQGPLKDRVSMAMCEGWYFREGGVIAFCVRLMQEFMNTMLNPEKVPTDGSMTQLENFILWDYDNRATFKILPFKILLTQPCQYERQRVTELRRTFWDSAEIQHLANNLNKNNGNANDISGLFIYSMVDPGHGAHALLELQKQRMEGVDKTRASYEEVSTEHTRINGPPWRTRNAEWSEDAIMENTNYQFVKNILDSVVIPDHPPLPESPPESPRMQEPTEPEIAVDVAARDPTDIADLVIPPEEERALTTVTDLPGPTRRRGDPTEAVEEEGDNNLLLFGGLAALTLGIGAVALSRRQS